MKKKYGMEFHLPVRHDDRDSPCLPAGRQDGQDRRVFFSFGTNDLTQMGFGFSRDDIGGFLPEYYNKEKCSRPIRSRRSTRRARTAHPDGHREGPQDRADLKIGICGEQGGDRRASSSATRRV